MVNGLCLPVHLHIAFVDGKRDLVTGERSSFIFVLEADSIKINSPSQAALILALFHTGHIDPGQSNRIGHMMACQIGSDGFPALPVNILGQIHPINISIAVNKFRPQPVEAFIPIHIQLDGLGLSRY
ncbi:hypothetical protein D3C75_783330 [compost metagenome]